jgi:hypothetical protein
MSAPAFQEHTQAVRKKPARIATPREFPSLLADLRMPFFGLLKRFSGDAHHGNVLFIWCLVMAFRLLPYGRSIQGANPGTIFEGLPGRGSLPLR